MDSEQRKRVENFEERQERREKRDKFGKIVFGIKPEEGSFLDFLGILALPIFLIRVVVGLAVWLLIGVIIKKAFKRTK